MRGPCDRSTVAETSVGGWCCVGGRHRGQCGDGGIWPRGEYDWSLPGTVRAVVRESNVFAPGSSWELTVEALPGGRSVVSWLARRQGAGFKGRLLTSMLRFRGEKLLAA